MMTIMLEKLPSDGVIARPTIGSLMILAHMISLASISSRSKQVFPENLLIQLLKVMLHPDVKARVGARQIFSVLLIPSSNHSQHEVASLRSNSAATFASVTALLDKLRKEKDGTDRDNHESNNSHDDLKEKDIAEEDCKQGRARKNSPNFYNLSSIIDRTAASTSLTETELCIMKLNEDQVAQLLSAFWIQATLSDNLPSNIEAIAHSFLITLTSSRLVNPNDNLMVRFFQLALSLRNTSMDPSNGMLCPARRRSILTLSTGMLMFAAKIYNIPDLNDMLRSLVPYDADPYLGISDDLQVHAKPQADVRQYGSAVDDQLASELLLELHNKIYDSENIVSGILVQNLSSITQLEEDDVAKQLSEAFTPDDAFMFGPQYELETKQMVPHSMESLSFDGDFPTSSIVDDDESSEASVSDISRFIPRTASPPPSSHVISIGQLLESALEVAGQVVGSSVSTSPLPYNAMTSQCEALGTGTRTKLSNWLAQENRSKVSEKAPPQLPTDGRAALRKIACGGPVLPGARVVEDPWRAMKLPPASPFDNFLRAAGC